MKKIFKEYGLVTLAGVFFSALFAVFLGQDINPNLVDYNFYSAFLALHPGRLLTDVIPSNIQGYFMNPYIYVPYYLLYKVMPPVMVGAVIGGIHGLNFILTYKIARLCLESWPPAKARIVSFLCAGFGLFNPFFLSMLGASWSNNLTPLFVLGGIILVLLAGWPAPEADRAISSRNRYLLFGLGGLSLGFATGFVLCNCTFLIALVPAWLFTRSLRGAAALKKCFKELFVIFFGAGIGYLVLDGVWRWKLWNFFQNPMFPYYNEIFKSKKIVSIWTGTPPPAAAQSFSDYLFYPFQWVVGIPPESEWQFRDIRFAIIYILVLGLILISIRSRWFSSARRPENAIPQPVAGRWKFILAWSGFSYLHWMHQFGALRYLIPVTLLTGIIIVLLLNLITQKRNVILLFFAVIGLICIYTMQLPPYGRLPWKQTWYPVRLPQELAAAPKMYFNNGMSLALPFFPKGSRFFGYMYLDPEDQLTDYVRNQIADRPMQMRTLTTSRWTLRDDEKLKMFSLKRKPLDCVTFSAAWAHYQSCEIEKIEEGVEVASLLGNLQIDFNKFHLFGVSHIDGFSAHEPDGSWTVGPSARIVLAGLLPSEFTLELTAYVFSKNSESGIDLAIGDQKRRIKLGNAMETIRTSFAFNSSREAGSTISFGIPYPTAPAEVDPRSGDTRKLGIFIRSLKIVSHRGPYEIDFRNLDSQPGIKSVSGFSIQEPAGRWTEGFRSTISFERRLPKKFRLSIRGWTLPTSVGKTVSIVAGDSKYSFELLKETNEYILEINNRERKSNQIELLVPSAVSPQEIGLNADTRRLGLFLEKLTIEPIEQERGGDR